MYKYKKVSVFFIICVFFISGIFIIPDKANAGIPTFTGVRTALNTINLTFNEAVTGTAIADSFTVGGASSVTNTVITGGTTMTLTTVGLTDTSGPVMINYVAATGDIVSDSTSQEIADGG